MNGETVCRTCLMETNESIFQVVIDGNIEIPLIVMLSDCMGIEVSEDDEISLNICDNCAEQTISYYKFRRKCLASEKKLLNELHSKLESSNDNRIFVSSNLEIEPVNDITFCDEIGSETTEVDMITEEVDYSMVSTDDPLETSKTVCVKESENIELPHACPICSRRFKRHFNMKRHLQVHEPPENRKRDVEIPYLYVCKFCDHEFVSKDHLQEHLLTHAGEKFMASGSLEEQFTTIINLEKDKPHECPKCNKRFKRRFNLKNHMLTHEPKENRVRVKRKKYVFTCDYCGHKFGYKNHLLQHLRKHTGEKPYKCELCDYSSGYYDGLKQHKASHSDERPYKCKFCDKWYKTATTRSMHQLKHLNRLFECETCLKMFKSRDSLRKHKISIHDIEKPPFICQYCNKKFSRLQNLEEHIQHVHDSEKSLLTLHSN